MESGLEGTAGFFGGAAAAGLAAAGRALGGAAGAAGFRGMAAGAAGTGLTAAGAAGFGAAAGGAAADAAGLGAAAGGAAGGAATAGFTAGAGTGLGVGAGAAFGARAARMAASLAALAAAAASCSLRASASASPTKCARTFSAMSTSSELECVFFSANPISGKKSIMTLALTSSSRARSLMRIWLAFVITSILFLFLSLLRCACLVFGDDALLRHGSFSIGSGSVGRRLGRL